MRALENILITFRIGRLGELDRARGCLQRLLL
jgi:hypothetical protein